MAMNVIRRGLLARKAGTERVVYKRGDVVESKTCLAKRFNSPGSRKFDQAGEGRPVLKLTAPSTQVSDIAPEAELREMDVVELRQIAEDNNVVLDPADGIEEIIAKLTGK